MLATVAAELITPVLATVAADPATAVLATVATEPATAELAAVATDPATAVLAVGSSDSRTRSLASAGCGTASILRQVRAAVSASKRPHPGTPDWGLSSDVLDG
ncbi:hypothetical protein AB4Z42_04055 [Mycobacterium sp. 2YAF39]|uniref:hypothetical protein n=1 Tax=Mycobacterium sp. 2YAF39 TaxID=3233033 RepID=UPI003F9C0476